MTMLISLFFKKSDKEKQVSEKYLILEKVSIFQGIPYFSYVISQAFLLCVEKGTCQFRNLCIASYAVIAQECHL